MLYFGYFDQTDPLPNNFKLHKSSFWVRAAACYHSDNAISVCLYQGAQIEQLSLYYQSIKTLKKETVFKWLIYFLNCLGFLNQYGFRLHI
jgi:hypothetical protein